MASILRDVPEAPIRVNPDLQPEIGRIIGKALEKDRDLRYLSAAELRADLKRLKRDADSKPLAAAAVPASSREISSERGRRKPYWLFAAALGIIGIAVTAFLFTRPLPSPRVL